MAVPLVPPPHREMFEEEFPITVRGGLAHNNQGEEYDLSLKLLA